MGKRILSCCLLVVLILLSVAGCGSNASADSASPDVSANPDGQVGDQGSESPALEPVELVIAFPYINKAPADIDLVTEEINKITQEKINATITLLPIGFGSWAEQSNLLLTGNEKVDLIAAGLGTPIVTSVNKGQFLELDELLAQYGQGIVDSLGERYLTGGRVGDNIYAVPTVRDLATSTGMMFAKDIVDKYNIDLSSVTQWSDFTDIFATIKAGEGENFRPLFSYSANYLSFTSTMGDALGDSLGVLAPGDTTGTVVNRFETPEYRELMELIRSWYEAGYFNTDAATTQVTYIDAIKSGIAACYPSNRKPGQEVNQSRITGKDIVGVTIGENAVYTGSLQAAMWSIPYQCEDPERAMMFLNMMYSDKDIANLLAWGVEGVHYVKHENGQIGYPEGVNAENTGWGINLGWLLGNQFLHYIWETDDPNMWEVTKEYNDNAIPSIALGFVFDASGVKTEYSACQAILKEYQIAIETGSVDLSKLDEMNAKLYDAGLQTIIDEKQAQLDAFLGK